MSPLDVVSAYIENKDGKILLLKRSSNNKSRKGMWQFPEGKTNFFEDPEKAIKRELAEELGLINTQIELINVYPFIYNLFGLKIKSKRHLYKVAVPKKIILGDEHSEYKWFSKKEALKLKLNAGIRDVLRSS